MAHKESICVITCIEKRLNQDGRFDALIHENFGKDFYSIESAGGAKAIADPLIPAKREAVLHDIGFVKDAADVNTVVIVDHDAKCAYYGIESAEAEEQAHRENLTRAAAFVQASFPDLRVILAMARIDNNNKLQKIEVVREVPALKIPA